MKRIRLKLAGLTALLYFSCGNLLAQDFNNTYLEANGRPIVKPKGNSLVVSDACRIYTANSARGFGATRDFQLTSLYPDGTFNNSYRYGASGADEFCHGLSQSMEALDEFLLCGESMSNNMLVMKVDLSGNVIWSKEVSFAGQFSEAISIIPTNNNPFDKGYIVIGNCGDHIAAVKFDEAGTVMWKHEYSSNFPMEMTDATLHKGINHRILTITGNYDNSGDDHIFAFTIMTGTGFIFQYPHAYESDLGIKDPQIVEVNPDLASFSYDVMLTFEKSNGAMIFPYQELGAVRIDAYNLGNVVWNYYYEPGQLWKVENNDLARVGTNRFTALGEIHFWPYLMQIDDNGNFGSVRSFVDVVTEPASLAESCGTGTEVFNGAKVGADDLRVVKQDNILTPLSCALEYTWPRNNLVFDAYDISVVRTPSGTVSNYALSVEQVLIDDVFNCLGDPLMVIENETEISYDDFDIEVVAGLGEENGNEQWFYPNPTAEQLTLNLTESDIQIAIYSLSGELIWNTTKQGRTTLNITDYAKGVYVIERSGVAGTVDRERLVIQ